MSTYSLGLSLLLQHQYSTNVEKHHFKHKLLFVPLGYSWQIWATYIPISGHTFQRFSAAMSRPFGSSYLNSQSLGQTVFVSNCDLWQRHIVTKGRSFCRYMIQVAEELTTMESGIWIMDIWKQLFLQGLWWLILLRGTFHEGYNWWATIESRGGMKSNRLFYCIIKFMI